MNTSYQNRLIKQLRDQQVRFAPRDKKLEQVDRAEKLLAELDREPQLPLRVSLLSDHRLPSRIRPQA